MSVRTSPSTVCIESLEPRLAPAGVVTLSTAGGVLTITGDGGDNGISITDVPASGEWTIHDPAAGGTTFVLNGASMGMGAFNVAAQNAIKAALGDGNDRLDILPSGITSGMVLAGVLNISGGNGNDTVNLGNTGTQSLQVLGAASVDLGADMDSLTVGGSVIFGGAVDIKAGAGNDTLTFGQAGGTAEHLLMKGLKVDLGSGGDTLSVLSRRFDVLGALAVGGAGIGGTVQTLNLSPEAGTVQGAASFAITNGNVQVSLGGDAAHQWHFNSSLKVTTGAGSDFLKVTGLVKVAGAVTLDFKEGGQNYLSLLPDASFHAASLSLKGGAGNDLLILGMNSGLRLSGALSLNLGSGNNSLSSNPGVVLAAASLAFAGGSGNDNLSFSGSTLQIAGGVSFNAGAGFNVLELVPGSGGAIGGAVTMTGGVNQDIASFKNLHVGGALVLDLKDGVNSVSVGVTSQVSAAGLVVKGGSGVDTLVLAGNSSLSLRGALTFQAGLGDNLLGMDPGSSLTAGSLSYVAGATGKDEVIISGASLTLHGAAVLNLGGGDNSVNLKPAVSAWINGAFSVTGLGGQDNVNFDTPLLTVNGAVNLNLGGGDNVCSMQDAQIDFNSFFSYTGGAGADALDATVTNLKINGAVTLNAGAGTNEFYFRPMNAVTGSLKYTGGAGIDELFLGHINGAGTTRLTVLGGLSAVFGDGENSLQVTDTWVQGPASLASTSATAADVFNINQSALNGAATVSMGGGISTLTVNDSVFRGAFTASTGAGMDDVSLDNAGATAVLSQWFGKVTLNTGADADTIVLGSSPFVMWAGNTFHRLVTVDGGAGADVFLEGGNNFNGTLVKLGML